MVTKLFIVVIVYILLIIELLITINASEEGM